EFRRRLRTSAKPLRQPPDTSFTRTASPSRALKRNKSCLNWQRESSNKPCRAGGNAARSDVSPSEIIAAADPARRQPFLAARDRQAGVGHARVGEFVGGGVVEDQKG